MIHKPVAYLRHNLQDIPFFGIAIFGGHFYTLFVRLVIATIVGSFATLLDSDIYTPTQILHLFYTNYKYNYYHTNRFINLFLLAPIWETFIFFYLPFHFVLPYFEKKNKIALFAHLFAFIFGLVHLFNKGNVIDAYYYGLLWNYIWYYNKENRYIFGIIVVAHSVTNIIHVCLSNLI